MKPIIFEGICEQVDSSLSGDDAEVRLRIDGQPAERATIHVSGDIKNTWIHTCHPCVDNWVVGRRLRIIVQDVTDDPSTLGVPMTATNHGRTIDLRWPDGTPVYAGQVKEGAVVRYDLKTGIVDGIEKP